jgi:hypothetical protein
VRGVIFYRGERRGRGDGFKRRLAIFNTIRFFGVAGLAIMAAEAGCASTPPATSEARSFDIRAFGAAGDGKTQDTAAVQKAIDASSQAGGGRVVMPAGDYLVGSLQLKSNTLLVLEKGTILRGSPDAADYPIADIRFEGAMTKGHEGLIWAENAEHIGVIGPGTLLGSLPLGNLRSPRGPTMGEFVHCKDIRLEEFSSKYQHMWNFHFLYCEDLKAKNLNIRSTPLAISDGMDIESTTHVRIDHCDIDTGDDCIALKSGKGVAALQLNKPTEDVVITDCVLGSHFAGLAVGTEMSGGVRNVRAERCHFTHGSNAIYIKSRTGRGGAIENIVVTDAQAETSTFLGINLLNKGTAGTDLVPGAEGIPVARTIEVSNAKVDCGTLVDGAHIDASKPLDGLVLSNITGMCKKGISLQNMVNVQLKGIQVTGFAEPLVRIDHVTGTGLEDAGQFTAPPTLIKPTAAKAPATKQGVTETP